MTTELICPTCGTVSYFEEVSRDASAFCRVCDYPLFWVRSARVTGGEATTNGSGLRRLPGTAGRVAIATLACPSCTEPNLLTASICIRCGADLHPAPVVEEPAAPEPIPVAVEPRPAAPQRTPPWAWILVGVAAIVAIVLILVLKVF